MLLNPGIARGLSRRWRGSSQDKFQERQGKVGHGISMLIGNDGLSLQIKDFLS